MGTPLYMSPSSTTGIRRMRAVISSAFAWLCMRRCIASRRLPGTRCRRWPSMWHRAGAAATGGQPCPDGGPRGHPAQPVAKPRARFPRHARAPGGARLRSALGSHGGSALAATGDAQHGALSGSAWGLELLDRLGVSSFQSSLFVAGVFFATFRILLWRLRGRATERLSPRHDHLRPGLPVTC